MGKQKIEMTKEWLEGQLKTKSTYVIAEEMGTYANKIRRFAQKNGIKIPNHSEAQKIALESGKVAHPTQGKERTKDVKDKIAEGVYQANKNMTEDKKAEISQKHKDIWAAMPNLTKEHIKSQAAKGVRKAAALGSKTELYLKDSLVKAGYAVDYHKQNLLGNAKLEIDLLLPSLRTVIEINGISHYEPIHGDDVLAKKKKADAEKYGLLISGGYCVVIVKHLVKNVSDIYHKKLTEKLVALLEQIDKKFPKKGERLIEIEV